MPSHHKNCDKKVVELWFQKFKKPLRHSGFFNLRYFGICRPMLRASYINKRESRLRIVSGEWATQLRKQGFNMKRFTIVAAAVIALGAAAPALAADLPAKTYTKAPAMIPSPIYDWSGFYIGINGGGGFSHKCWDLTVDPGGPIGPEGCHDASGGTLGGQIGYRWQMASWVFGLEAQGNWADLRGDNVSLLFPAFRNESHIGAF